MAGLYEGDGTFNETLYMIDPALLDFLDVLSDMPEDDISWQHLAQLLAERDELETAAFVRRDFDMIRRCLRMTWSDLAMIRVEARKVNSYAVLLVDCLTPRLRRSMVYAARLLVGPPPLPRVAKRVKR